MEPRPPAFGDRRRRVVGLLGGSFNPAHAGHVHISVEALRRLGVDQVWWLVSPQNPLKPADGMAPLADRMASARCLPLHHRIIVTDIEIRLGSTRTAAVLDALNRRYPAVAFIWMMGADNLRQIPKWWRWSDIFTAARVAVFDRNPYSYRALAGAAAMKFARSRKRNPRALGCSNPPAWSYLAIRRHGASATALRRAAQNVNK
ncbi:MAG: nicotinate-nicotinamide nucleotide adenylyltransferase [Rhodospirillaceae bacterium]|nr:nicotinate-nicotinamide nucleotide adenylyltransferase [Rhodospirillaceae bacterium]